jgi:phosphoribosyl-ATP pyrophosphohydrolase/phosphoribosyl-AMP cyclohydrolase
MGVTFDKDGLVPAVVQDGRTGRVRMVGYVNEEALRLCRETGWLHLYSRSRGRLWKKGETSGNLHRVVGASADCDGDAVLLSVLPQGPTCHTGAPSCFFDLLWGAPPGGLLDRLGAAIRQRRLEMPEGSRTAALFRQGLPRIARKVGEEAVETAVAALGEGRDRVREEAADLLYHLLVLLEASEVSWEEVLGVLAEREGGPP